MAGIGGREGMTVRRAALGLVRGTAGGREQRAVEESGRQWGLRWVSIGVGYLERITAGAAPAPPREPLSKVPEAEGRP